MASADPLAGLHGCKVLHEYKPQDVAGLFVLPGELVLTACRGDLPGTADRNSIPLCSVD